MAGAHARLSASSAHRWLACPGSVRLSEHMPNRSSAAAAEGTFAHTIAARCLSGGSLARHALGETATVGGYAVVCDEDMVRGVQVYLDYIDAQPGKDRFVEVPLAAALRRLDPDFGGTADLAIWNSDARELLVVDFKYGAGTLVSPFENEQALLYAIGALLELGVPAATVRIAIVQPRIDHPDGVVREWRIDAATLLEHIATFREGAARTREADAPLVPGEAQCKFCPAKRTCPKLEEAQALVVRAQFEAQAYDPTELAALLEAAPLVEARIEALRAFAYDQAVRGATLPGWKLVDKRATRVWSNEADAERWMLERGVEPRHPGKLKSPAQVETEIGKGKTAREALAPLVSAVSSGYTLVPDSDKRPAAQLKIASADEFAVIGRPADAQQ